MTDPDRCSSPVDLAGIEAWLDLPSLASLDRWSSQAEWVGLDVRNLRSIGDASPQLITAPAYRATVVVDREGDHLPDTSRLPGHVFLTAKPDPPYGWVCPAGGIGRALDRIRFAVQESPLTAAMLCEVLSTTANLPLSHALTVESLAYSVLLSGPEHAKWLRDHPDRGSTSSAPEPVVASRHGPNLVITLNRPERRNAVDAMIRDSLCDVLDLARVDRSVRRVWLIGRGPCFSSGGDLAEFGSATDPALAHLVRMTRSAGWRIAELGNAVTAAVQGPCVGAGVELPAFAHSVLASPDATFRLPELSMGLIPGAGGTVSITRRIGAERLRYLALSGDAIDADTALAWGLIDHIIPAASIADAADTLSFIPLAREGL